jgi:hypothetical protein
MQQYSKYCRGWGQLQRAIREHDNSYYITPMDIAVELDEHRRFFGKTLTRHIDMLCNADDSIQVHNQKTDDDGNRLVRRRSPKSKNVKVTN